MYFEILFGGLLGVPSALVVRNADDARRRLFFAATLVIAALIYLRFAAFGVYGGVSESCWLPLEIAGVAVFSFAAF